AWGLPLTAATLTLVGLVLAFRFVLLRLGEPPPQKQAPVAPPAPRFDAAQKLLAEGRFRLAADELEGLDQAGHTLTLDDRRGPARLRRQAGLLADLPAEPLEEGVRHPAGVHEPEWQRDFPHRYQGRAVLLDAEVSLANGQVHVNYRLFRVGDREVRLD